MSMIASVLIAKGSLFFLEGDDEFESQPGGVDLKRQGGSAAACKPREYFMCSQITACVFALVSRMRLCLRF